MTVNRKTFCTYDEGMFANEPRVEDYFAAHAMETASATHHEAGHAVLSYATGFGIDSVSMTKTVGRIEDEKTYLYNGEYVAGGDGGRFDHLGQASHRHVYERAILALGIVKAAGAAAERKFCIGDGAPIRTRGAGSGDDRDLRGMARAL